MRLLLTTARQAASLIRTTMTSTTAVPATTVVPIRGRLYQVAQRTAGATARQLTPPGFVAARRALFEPNTPPGTMRDTRDLFVAHRVWVQPVSAQTEQRKTLLSLLQTGEDIDRVQRELQRDFDRLEQKLLHAKRILGE